MNLKKKLQDELVNPATDDKRIMRLNYFLGNKTVIMIITILLDILLILFGSYLINVLRNIPQMIINSSYIGQYVSLDNIFPLFQFSGNSKLVFLFVIGIIDLIFIYKMRVAFNETDLNKGQKGTSRFTTLTEIKEQYKEVPARDEIYPGRGGMLISRHEDKLYLENNPAHTIVLGITRSGKDELILRPMIEVNSRAEEQPSMIIVDLKLENYKSTSETLRERGYDVYLINLAFPQLSDGIELLDKIKARIMEGDIDEAEAQCVQMADILFSNQAEVESENSRYFKDNATNVLEAMIFAQTEDCLKMDQEMDRRCMEKWEEKQKQYSLYSEQTQMQIEVQFEHEKKNFFEKHSEDYHTGMWQDYMLKKMKAIPEHVAYVPCTDNIKKVTLYSVLYTFSNLAEAIVNQKTGKTKLDEYFEKRPVNDKARKCFSSIKIAGSEKTKGNIYSTMLSSLKLFMRNDIGMLSSQKSFDIDDIGFGKRPVALFLGLPEYDTTKNGVVSILLTQIYYELSRKCALGKGECARDVFILFNEAGNCPAIPNFPVELTTSAARRIYWVLFLQELQQLKDLYKESYKTLFSNCGNKIYLKSGDQDTNKEFSEMIGNQTITTVQRNGKKLSLDKSLYEHFEEQALQNPNQLMQEMLVGENIVLRIMHPYDNKGNPIKQYPIFNRYENGTQFVPAHQYLADVFPDHRTIDFAEMVKCSRKHIKLEDTLLDLSQFNKKKLAVNLGDLCTFSGLLEATKDILGEAFVKENAINEEMKIQQYQELLMRKNVEKLQAMSLLTILEGGME